MYLCLVKANMGMADSLRSFAYDSGISGTLWSRARDS